MHENDHAANRALGISPVQPLTCMLDVPGGRHSLCLGKAVPTLHVTAWGWDGKREHEEIQRAVLQQAGGYTTRGARRLSMCTPRMRPQSNQRWALKLGPSYSTRQDTTTATARKRQDDFQSMPQTTKLAEERGRKMAGVVEMVKIGSVVRTIILAEDDWTTGRLDAGSGAATFCSAGAFLGKPTAGEDAAGPLGRRQ